MSQQRRGSGFAPAGSIGPEDLGLPRKRARELLLALAWRRAAGEVWAQRAPACRVRRGVFEVETSEPACAERLLAVLPSLAARIAADCPTLGIRKCRVVQPGRPPADPVPLADPDEPVLPDS